MLNDGGSCCGNGDKINSLSPDFLLYILYMCICIGGSLMIWPDVVFGWMSHFTKPAGVANNAGDEYMR